MRVLRPRALPGSAGFKAADPVPSVEMTGDIVDSERCQQMLADLPHIENVCVFMADAHRWDHLPDAVAERGPTYKTVAASLTTHTSLLSMLSGLWSHNWVLSGLYHRGKPSHSHGRRWVADGGWTGNTTPWLRRRVAVFGLLAGSRWEARHMRRSLRHYPNAAAHYLRSRERFGDSSFGYEEEVDWTEAVETTPRVVQTETPELTEVTVERLDDFGYI